MIADSVGFVVDRGREAVYDAEHFFDGYKADRDYAFSTLRAARQAGARTLVLCDTNGGTMTNELVAIVGDVRATLEADHDAPAVTWGIHTHNDADLAVANSLAAVAAGIRHVQATINGYGERAGNANMVSVLANLALKTSHALVPAGGGDLPGLTELSRSVAEIANITPNDYQPYVGRSAFAHKGGVHGAAVAKVERSYQHIDPTAVGNVGRLVVSELGGRANISIRAEQLGHQLEGVVDPRELSQLIKQLEADGLAFEGAEASFELLIRRHAAEYVAPFRIVDYTCLVEQRDGRELLAEATVKVEVDGEILHTAADGNGPVNALDAALRKALRAFYPGIEEVHLVELQGAHPRRRGGHRGADARRHRLDGWRPDLVHDGQRHEHHRGVGLGAGRLARIRDLEIRLRAPTPGRASLHDGPEPRSRDATGDPWRDSDPTEVTP